jgi:hypothetical protein
MNVHNANSKLMHQNKRKEKLNIENRELLSRSFILAIL